MSTARKTVLIVIGTLQVGGGAERVAARLGSELVARGYDVQVLTFYEATERYACTATYHTLHESLKRTRLSKVWRIPWRLWRIRTHIDRVEPDVVVSFLEEANFYCLLTKRLWRLPVPVVVSVRNNILHRGRLFCWLMARLYPRAQAVVSVTKSVAEILQTVCKLNNVVTIYNPIDPVVVQAGVQQPLPPAYASLADEPLLVLSIGRLVAQKGQWQLVRAFSQVVRTLPEARLVIVGAGPLRESLERLVQQSGLTESITLAGTQANVYPFLAAARLFAFSSLYEGMPNTLLEAYSVGVPIVTTDCVSGPREIIAPELGLDEIVEYPYRTASGVLVEPGQDQACWEPATTKPLSAAEQMLAAEIITILQRATQPGVPDDARFALTQIVDQWERALFTS